MQQPEDRTLCERGDQAELLLKNQAFTELFVDLSASFYRAWANTQHDQGEAREFLFAKAAALQDILNTLMSRVATRDQIMLRVEQPDEDNE